MIKKLQSRVVYQNKWMTVREDDVQFQHGHTGIYSVVEKPDFVIIIPFDGANVYLVEQYRYALGRTSLEFPQGSHEGVIQNESYEEMAKSELLEETGLTAKTLKQLGSLTLAVGYSRQRVHVFLATDLSQTKKQTLDAYEDIITVKTVLPSELRTLILNGDFADSASVAAYGLWTLET